jgi:hypothetical protein
VIPPDTLPEVQERVVLRAQRAVLAAQRQSTAMLDRVIDAPALSRMIYAFGSDGVSSWMVEEIHNRLFRLGLRITSTDHQMQMMLAATVERATPCSLLRSAATTPKSSRRRASPRITAQPQSRSRFASSACEGGRSRTDD